MLCKFTIPFSSYFNVSVVIFGLNLSHHSDHNYSTDSARESPPVVSEDHICSKSIYLELTLQRSKEIIKKLQKRCAEKTAEIGRLKSAVKRLAISKSNLKDVLHEIKERKMISDDGHQVLQVNVFNL